MRRKNLLILAIIMLCTLLLWGCGKTSMEDATEDIPRPTLEETTSETQPEPETEPQTEPPVETAPPVETQPPTEPEPETEPEVQEQSEVPYLLTIPRADQSIYKGPGYDYAYARTVELAGIYTIVEEQWDTEGNLWGKLKSGAGWVDLTEIRQSEASPEPLTVNYADAALLSSGNYHHFVEDTSEYAIPVAFRANEAITGLEFCEMIFTDAGMEAGPCLYALDRLDPQTPLVIDMDFPGDMSSYEIRFVDADNTSHRCELYMSGRNGALCLSYE